MLTIVSWCSGGKCDPCKPVPTPTPTPIPTPTCIFLTAQGYFSDNFTSNINVGQTVQNYLAAGNAQKVCNPSMLIQLATVLFSADGTSVGSKGLIVKWPILKGNGSPNPSSISGTFQMGFGAAGGAPGGGLAAFSGAITGLIFPGDHYYTGELPSGIPGNTLVYTGLLPSNPGTYVVCKFYTGQIDARPRLPLGAALYD